MHTLSAQRFARSWTALPHTSLLPQAPLTVRHGRPLAGVLNSRFQSHATPARLTLSSVEGPLNPPLATDTLYGYFEDKILRLHADRPALVCRSEKPRAHGGHHIQSLGVDHLAWNFGELDVQVRALARGLVGLGVKKGDRVGVIMGNNRYVCLNLCVGGLIQHVCI